jgi:WD40 repeat protein
MRFASALLFVIIAASAFAADPDTPRSGAADRLPPGATARFGSAKLRHDAKALAFLDAKTLASFGDTLRIWDATTGRMRAEHQSPQMLEAIAAGFSGDGKTLITAHMPDVYRAWDVTTGKMALEMKSEGAFAVKVAFPLAVSADGKRFASLAEDLKGPRIWTVQKDEKPTRLPDAVVQVVDVSIAPDGSRAAGVTGTHGLDDESSLLVWDAATGKRLRHDDLKRTSLRTVAFSADGARVAAGTDGQGWAVRTLDGKEVWKHDSSDEVVGLYFTPDRHLIVVYETQAGDTAKARLVDEATGKLVREWDLGREAEIKAAVSPDSRLFAITSQGRLRIWNIADGTEVMYSGGHTSAICTTCITPDSRFIASTDFQDKDVILWDVATGQEVRRFQGHTAGCIEIVFSPNGKLLASSSYDRTVRIWEVATGKELHQLTGFPVPVWHLRFIADNESLALAPHQGNSISVYHCPTGKKVREMVAAQMFSLSSLLRHPDGRILAIDAAAEQTNTGQPHVPIQIVDVLASRPVQRFEGHSARLVCSILSPDGRTVATRGDDGQIRLWEVASGQERAQLSEGTSVNSTGTQFMAFSPDGRTIASANRREPKVYLWDVVGEKQFASFSAHERPMYTVEYTPDGKRLITGSMDATLLAWDMTAPERRSRELVRTALTKEELTRLWNVLRDGTAAEAYKAKWALVADPEATVAFLRGKFETAKQTSPEKIKAWLTDLDSPKYPTREAAEKNLLAYFDQAEEELRKAHEKSTGEARKRIAGILETEFAAIPRPEVLRELRAVEVLDAIGTKAALDVLRRLTPGKVRARVAKDAATTLRRLDMAGR